MTEALPIIIPSIVRLLRILFPVRVDTDILMLSKNFIIYFEKNIYLKLRLPTKEKAILVELIPPIDRTI